MRSDATSVARPILLLTSVVAAGLCLAAVFNDIAAFFRAWLVAYVFWLGLPLCGEWMETTRPALDAAITTMPLATLAGIPAFIGLESLFTWVHPKPELSNVFYLNPGAFYLRYAIYVVLWNAIAAFALLGSRNGGEPIAPALSWLSGIALILLAFSVSFASIDWLLSLLPTFWSSIFPMAAGAGWFNTGLAIVVLAVVFASPAAGKRRDHIADLAQILLATTILWFYTEFMQFLIVWEADLKNEIEWYLHRSEWRPALFVAIALGFIIPFLVLLWRPTKRSRVVLAIISFLILVGHGAAKWWLVLPMFGDPPPFWLDVAATVALGSLMLLMFLGAMRRGSPRLRWPALWRTRHG
jgi:hypothetical protein